MVRFLVLFLTFASLAGCYNPRYPSEVPGAEPVPHETGNSQETSVRDRNRNRDGAAGSGASRTY
jgi:hypothetical protein